MKKGTLTLNIFGELLFDRSVETFITSMDQTFRTISDKIESQYRRFGFYAATIQIIIPLLEFWKTDHVYNSLKYNLNHCFDNWSLDLNLTYNEKGV